LCVDRLKTRSGGRTIDLVFNTHHHADHTVGDVREHCGAKGDGARHDLFAGHALAGCGGGEK
jgi:glyoxylase-like metal-dependent hydrolase (beta-lactamase superfamily II)